MPARPARDAKRYLSDSDQAIDFIKQLRRGESGASQKGVRPSSTPPAASLPDVSAAGDRIKAPERDTASLLFVGLLLLRGTRAAQRRGLIAV